jgi:hypothetical protein
MLATEQCHEPVEFSLYMHILSLHNKLTSHWEQHEFKSHYLALDGPESSDDQNVTKRPITFHYSIN